VTDYKTGFVSARLSVCPSVRTLTVAFLDRFSPLAFYSDLTV